MKGMVFWAVIFGIGAASAQVRWGLPWWLPLSVGGILLTVLAPRLSAMTEPTNGANEVMDFTIHREPIRFKIDDDEFAAPAIISPIVLKRVAVLFGRYQELSTSVTDLGNVDEMLTLIADMFKTIIPGEHGRRFAERLLSEDNPIDLNQQAVPVLFYLLEQWGLRPTPPSSNSPDGSSTTTIPNGDTSSTGGAFLAASDNPPSVQLTG